jgi:hypothetical protein
MEFSAFFPAMLWVLLMFFDPVRGWQRAAEAARSYPCLVLCHLLPLALVGCVAEGWGMARWGKRLGEFGTLHRFPMEDIVRYEAVRFGLAVLLVLGVAVLLKQLANTFHSRNGFRSALAAAVFGLGPVLLLRVADMFPWMPMWLTWLVGAVLSAAILYQGIPRLLHTDPAHAMGLYFCGAALVVLASAVAHLLGLFFLHPDRSPLFRDMATVAWQLPVA